MMHPLPISFLHLARFAARLLMAWVLCQGAAWAQPGPIELIASQGARSAPLSESWHMSRCNAPADPEQGFAVLRAEALTRCTTRVVSGQREVQQPDAPVWYRITHPQGVAPMLTMAFFQLRQPHLKSFIAYERVREGVWQEYRAGTDVPGRLWRLPVATPSLEMHALPMQDSEYFVRIEHDRFTSPELVLLNAFEGVQSIRLNLFFSSALVGMMVLYFINALFLAISYRSLSFTLLCAYAVLSSFAMLVSVGLAPVVLWPDSVDLTRIGRLLAPALMGLGCCAMLLVSREILLQRPRLRKAILLCTLSVVFTCVAIWIPHISPWMQQVQLVFLLIGSATIAYASLVLVRSEEFWQKIMGVAYFPLGISIVFLILSSIGWIPTLAMQGIWFSWGVVLHLYLLSIAFQRKERGLWMLKQRVNTSNDIDRVTGLVFSHIALQLKLPRMHARSLVQHHAIALVMVRWVKPPHVAQALDVGQYTVDIAALLSKLVRNVDTVTRMQNGDFLLLIEGPSTAARINQLATAIIASGLREQGPGLTGLQFVVAGVQVQGHALDSTQLLHSLSQTLDRLTQGTGRRIHIYEANGQQMASHPPVA